MKNGVTYLEEFSCVLITVCDSDNFAVDTDVKTYSEVRWLVRGFAILLKDHLSA